MESHNQEGAWEKSRHLICWGKHVGMAGVNGGPNSFLFQAVPNLQISDERQKQRSHARPLPSPAKLMALLFSMQNPFRYSWMTSIGRIKWVWNCPVANSHRNALPTKLFISLIFAIQYEIKDFPKLYPKMELKDPVNLYLWPGTDCPFLCLYETPWIWKKFLSLQIPLSFSF